MIASVRIYVVTYRRPHLLERALRSLLAQTHTAWLAEVLNDDPSDASVPKLINGLSDPRIRLSLAARHRGGTGNFNHAFRSVVEPYASILEDDNWWEPSFLEIMLGALEPRKSIVMALANDILWQEQPDGSWINTGKTIWPATNGVEAFDCRPLDKCGSAKLCNSAMLFRTAGAETFQTPESIPIDVTEHFRERVVPHPVLLVRNPLVNYGNTLVSHRSKGRKMWAQYQILLIGSVFKLAQESERSSLASALWRDARSIRPLLRNALLATGCFIPEARNLWRKGTRFEKLLYIRSCARRPNSIIHGRNAIRDHEAAWKFLQAGWFADFIRNRERSQDLAVASLLVNSKQSRCSSLTHAT
jgi:glycosyltransferase involved in cell wall biosynthesis